jgi:hypothetical protein
MFETGGVSVVARDGYPQHYALLSISLNDILLDPKLELRQIVGNHE